MAWRNGCPGPASSSSSAISCAKGSLAQSSPLVASTRLVKLNAWAERGVARKIQGAARQQGVRPAECGPRQRAHARREARSGLACHSTVLVRHPAKSEVARASGPCSPMRQTDHGGMSAVFLGWLFHRLLASRTVAGTGGTPVPPPGRTCKAQQKRMSGQYQPPPSPLPVGC